MNIEQSIANIAKQAKQASYKIAYATTEQKNNILEILHQQIQQNQDQIIIANQKDLKQAKENQLSEPLIDRLILNANRIKGMLESIKQIIQLSDPIGCITDATNRPSGIQVSKMRVPLGVVAVIYESRPNVTQEVACLAIKSGNACILKGGKEALHSNLCLTELIHNSLKIAGLDEHIVQCINTTQREAVQELLKMNRYIDVVIPRGSKSLIEVVNKYSTIPVIKHLDGNCHIYVDNSADLTQAIAVIVNAKTQRDSTCCSLESLLIHQDLQGDFLQKLAIELTAKGVEIRVEEKLLATLPQAKLATEDDYFTEYLAPIISIKAVTGLDEAIQHINHYGSGHTDSILSNNYEHIQKFIHQVDSSSTMVNTSTRFADGFEYGLGAEVGISTDKIHVRGPVGLEGLTTQKYIVNSNYSLRK